MSVALREHRTATNAGQTLGRVTASDYSVAWSEQDIRSQIETRYDKWANGIGALILPVPYDKIDLAELAEKALWRKPPFERDDPDAYDKGIIKEKGFRDALVLEAVARAFGEEQRQIPLIFASGDSRLREAASERFAKDDRVKIPQESLKEYLAELRLAHEAETKQFEDAIKASAETAFEKELVNKATAMAEEKFKPSLRQPRFRSALSKADGVWKYDRTPQFQNRNQNRWVWKSLLYYQREFKREPGSLYSPLSGLFRKGEDKYSSLGDFMHMPSVTGKYAAGYDFLPVAPTLTFYDVDLRFAVVWSCIADDDSASVSDLRIEDISEVTEEPLSVEIST